MSPTDVGRHDQAVNDLREVPREIEGRLVASFRSGVFQTRWDAIVTQAEAEGTTGKGALLIATRELMIDFVELVRVVLAEREKQTFEQLQK